MDRKRQRTRKGVEVSQSLNVLRTVSPQGLGVEGGRGKAPRRQKARVEGEKPGSGDSGKGDSRDAPRPPLATASAPGCGSRVGKTSILTPRPAGGPPAAAAARRRPGRSGGRCQRPLAERTEAPGQNTGRSGPQRAGSNARTAGAGPFRDP